jgi:MYXO-CTERM domain-containing protein
MARFRWRSPCCVVALVCAASVGEAADLGSRTVTQWSPYAEWSVQGVSFAGNPYDVSATATFIHADTQAQVTTSFFHDGGSVWKVRFAGTRRGAWSFTTSSANPDLDGHSGSVTVTANPNPAVHGFIVAAGSQFAVQVGDPEDLRAHLPQPYMDLRTWGSTAACGWTPASTFASAADVDAYLDAAERHGSNTVFALIANDWQTGDDPNRATFEVLEKAIARASGRGMAMHIWAWGDAERGWVPNGGVNGEPDRRLQRYLAARLGPVVGWTMGYGFDLFEWVTPSQVKSWRDYLMARLGWEHLLWARHENSFVPTGLDVYATDKRLEAGFYDEAVADLAGGLPVIYERRFAYLRDGVWDMQTTRRARWQLAIAGGAGAIWGHYPPGCTAYVAGDYPNPEQLRTHRRFWDKHLRLGMERDNAVTSAGWALRQGTGHTVVYAQDVSALTLTLGASGPAIAVNARQDYAELDLGVLPAGSHTVTLPAQSDWAIAVGDFEACPAARLRCSGQCVEVATEPAHCGACDNACPAQQACVAGLCSPDTDGGSVQPDAGSADADAGIPDAGTSLVDGGTAGSGERVVSGCGCVSGGASAGAWLLLAVGLLLTGRRRRRTGADRPSR